MPIKNIRRVAEIKECRYEVEKTGGEGAALMGGCYLQQKTQ